MLYIIHVSRCIRKKFKIDLNQLKSTQCWTHWLCNYQLILHFVQRIRIETVQFGSILFRFCHWIYKSSPLQPFPMKIIDLKTIIACCYPLWKQRSIGTTIAVINVIKAIKLFRKLQAIIPLMYPVFFSKSHFR